MNRTIPFRLTLLCFISFLVFNLSCLTLKAQSDSPAPPADRTYTIVQQLPKFKGDVSHYLQKHIKYPKSARMAGKSGKVFVTFIVEKDGAITNVKVLRGVPDAPELDAEAVRVISKMPKWEPGMQNGQVVRVQFNIPIDFQLK